ncbi:MAG TPA: aminotransferase class IV [Spirochaetota bacterium]|nr:aminotransferase class IV [Spirochaetota bacterium]HQQ24030.1 aminotransferase class IV [Spirochaetota bacterium]
MQTFLKYFPHKTPFTLMDIQPDYCHGIGRCKLRILYSENDIDHSVSEYKPKKIRSAAVVECNDAEYSFKHEDRSLFSSIINNNYDEIIILKNGFVTDSTFSNLAFYDSGKWFTPETFLLNGTMRQSLLADNIIHEKRIAAEDIRNFEKISFINSMLDLGESCLSTDEIVLNY